LTVAQLLQVCRFTSPKIAVFVEDELIRREDYDHHLIPDGAAVKVLHLIGGG
jgi:thiamine biosynthesis protein ThiS